MRMSRMWRLGGCGCPRTNVRGNMVGGCSACNEGRAGLWFLYVFKIFIRYFDSCRVYAVCFCVARTLERSLGLPGCVISLWLALIVALWFWRFNQMCLFQSKAPLGHCGTSTGFGFGAFENHPIYRSFSTVATPRHQESCVEVCC